MQRVTSQKNKDMVTSLHDSTNRRKCLRLGRGKDQQQDIMTSKEEGIRNVLD